MSPINLLLKKRGLNLSTNSLVDLAALERQFQQPKKRGLNLSTNSLDHLAALEREFQQPDPSSLVQQALFRMEAKTNPQIKSQVDTVQRNLERMEIRESVMGGRDQSNIPLQFLQEKIRRRNVASGSSVTVTPASKSTTTSPTNRPAASSEVSSEKAAGIAGYENMMGGGATLLTAGAGGLIGGVTSYATGGDFFQGAAAGSIIGAGGVAAGMGIMNANRSFLAKNAAGINDAVSSMSTSQRRNAMFAGAGLSGMVFGGDRRSHRRGFNQSRGNTF